MKKVRIEDLQPGMVLARSIYSPDGRILVKERTELTGQLLTRLSDLGLPAAYIESVQEINVAELVSDITRVDLIRGLSKLDQEIRAGKKLNLLSNKQLLYSLIDEINSNRNNPLSEFPDIRLHSDYLYGHSVNVCVIAVKMGLKLTYNQLKLADLAIGALYHDIGMTQIPLTILDKKQPLTEAETKIIRTHPEIGYNFLKGNDGLSHVSIHVAYQHHERYNGSGYPRGMAGTAIHEFARIVAIVDVFDSLITEKIYRKAKSFEEAVDYIQSNSGTEFDPEMVEVFLKIIK